MEFQLPGRIKLPEAQEVSVREASTKGQPWTDEEHRAFLQGLLVHGKGKWRQIARHNMAGKKTPTQVASHAQKFFTRQKQKTKRASRFTSIEEPLLRASGQPFCTQVASTWPPATTSGSAHSDSSCCSEGWSQDSQPPRIKPCRPQPLHAAQAGQSKQATIMLEAVLQLSRSLPGTQASISLPSTHSAFSSARPAAVMV